MAVQDEQVLVGVVANYKEALHAVDELRGEGFTDDEISVVARHHEDAPAPDPEPDKEDSAAEQVTETPDNSGKGAAIGGVVGGVGGFLAGVAALLIPGVGPILAVGPLLGALGGAAAGAVTGTLVGTLVDLGVPEERARHYQDRLHEGEVIVSVHADDADRAEVAWAVLRKYDSVARRPPVENV